MGETFYSCPLGPMLPSGDERLPERTRLACEVDDVEDGLVYVTEIDLRTGRIVCDMMWLS